jgi:hypothetical protein
MNLSEWSNLKTKLPAVHHARTRLGCNLNAHLCNNLHVIPSPRCQCGYELEDSMHYYLHCPLFDNQRNAMNAAIASITDVTVDAILYGDPNHSLDENRKVFDAVHAFILDTERFDI